MGKKFNRNSKFKIPTTKDTLDYLLEGVTSRGPIILATLESIQKRIWLPLPPRLQKLAVFFARAPITKILQTSSYPTILFIPRYKRCLLKFWVSTGKLNSNNNHCWSCNNKSLTASNQLDVDLSTRTTPLSICAHLSCKITVACLVRAIRRTRVQVIKTIFTLIKIIIKVQSKMLLQI